MTSATVHELLKVNKLPYVTSLIVRSDVTFMLIEKLYLFLF